MEQSYKEKYEDILARLERAKNDNEVCDERFCCVINEIIPELAESEDEQIRKWIINEIKIKHHNLDEENVDFVDKAIAWLERQGEHANFLSKIQVGDKVTRNENGVLVNLSQLKRVAKPSEKQGEQKYTQRDIDDAYLKGIADVKREVEKIDEQTEKMKKEIAEFIFNSKEYIKQRYEWIKCLGFDVKFSNEEKQGEQKPADKVEPKFKVGDKIYLKPEYRMPDDDTPIANTVKEIRGIDDKHYRFDGSYIFIEDQDKYELVEQKPKENKGNIGGISPNWSEEDEINVYNIIHFLEEPSMLENNEPCKKIVIDWLQSLKDRVQPQPKQEWSDEDEQHIDSLLKRLDALCRNKFERTRFAISEDRDWLKSLKDRVGCEAKCTTTKEWSEDDEKIINGLIDSLTRISLNTRTDSTSPNYSFYKEIDWLKSLRPQNHWKPSDVQMNNK